MLSAFYDILDANNAFEKEIEYLRTDRKIRDEEKGVNLAYFMQCISENKLAINEMYAEYYKRNPRHKFLEDEIKIILDFRSNLKNTISENHCSEDYANEE